MMVSNRGSMWGLLRWQWRFTALFILGGCAAAGLHMAGFDKLNLPAVPMGVVGGAIGIFVSFRTNSAYDRWWEGRKLWGRLINTSRHWCSQVLSYVGEGEGNETLRQEVADRMVRRQVHYVHVLRILLRKQSLLEDAELSGHLDDAARQRLASQSNATHALLHDQMMELRTLHRGSVIDNFMQSDMDESLRHLLDIQGGCERIKGTPFPRGYGFIAERLVLAYSVLFPFAIVAETGWWCVPLNVLVCLAFALISEAGRVLEDPFSVFWNGLPLSALARKIEVNLRERLGDTELPPMLQPDDNGILM
jgi:putative membrane protein